LYGHHACRIFHPRKDSTQVHGYHCIELLQISIGNDSVLRTSPGVVHQAIESAEAVHGMVNHRLDVGFDGNVCPYEARGIAKFSREGFSSVFAPADNHDLRPFPDENFGGAGADAACASRNDCNLAFQSSHLLPICISLVRHAIEFGRHAAIRTDSPGFGLIARDNQYLMLEEFRP
jgi:hypothetical protein